MVVGVFSVCVFGAHSILTSVTSVRVMVKMQPFSGPLMLDITPEQHSAFHRALEAVPGPRGKFGSLEIRVALISFVSPTAVLVPEPGIKVFCLVWFFFLHPGSTNTGGVISFNSNILDEIGFETGRPPDRRAQEVPPFCVPSTATSTSSSHCGREMSSESRRRRSFLTVARQPSTSCKGPGSMEGFGVAAASAQNLDMSVGFHVEGKMWIRFLENEGGVNQAMVTTLFERKRKSFSIYWSFMSACGASTR